MRASIVIAVSILLGGVLGHLLRLPSGVMVGGMVAGLLVKGVTLGDLPSGDPLSVVSQLLVAYVIVSNSDVASLRAHPEAVPAALFYIALLLTFCIGMAFVVTRFFGIDLQTAVYATAPGALSGMALSATDAGAENARIPDLSSVPHGDRPDRHAVRRPAPQKMTEARKLWDEPLCRALRRRIGRALGRYRMIAEGNRIVVGLSGGKDSLLLLHALSDLQRRSPVRFELAACTVALTGMDVSPLREYCAARNVPYTALEHPIMEIIESRAERSPCSFCANMRRGLLSTWAHDNGFDRLALGHSLDDAVETFFLNLLRAGRARSFQPTAHMTRSNVTVIRPLIASPEAAIVDEVKRLGLPVLKTVCPFAGGTERQRVKDLLETLRRDVPDLFSNVVNAMENLSDADRWTAAADTGKA